MLQKNTQINQNQGNESKQNIYEKPIMRENITGKVTFNERYTEDQKKEEETKMEEKNEQIKPTKNTEQEKLLNEEEANIFIK